MSNIPNMSGDEGSETAIKLPGRDRKPTEKGLEWQHEINMRNFRASVSTWKKLVKRVELMLFECQEPSLLREQRDILDEESSHLMEKFQLASSQAQSGDSIFQIYDDLNDEHYRLTRSLCDKIKRMDPERSEKQSHVSRRSNASLSSARSLASSRAEIKAKAAALKAKLKYIDLEAKVKADLNKLETMKELDMAEASLKAINTEIVDDGSSCHDEGVGSNKSNTGDKDSATSEQKVFQYNHIDILSRIKSLNPSAAVFTPENENNPMKSLNSQYPATSPRAQVKVEKHEGFDVTSSQENLTTESMSESGSHFIDLAKTFTEQMSLSRIPPPEPGVFSGDPLQYPGWKSAFHVLIERKCIPTVEKIHYLKRFLSGAAMEAVSGYLLLSSPDAYDKARCILDERFGDPFIVAAAFRDKLDQWPKIQARDTSNLRKFADFLHQCETAMEMNQSLRVLDDDRENRKLLTKLPDWMVTRWARVASEWRQEKRIFPPFTEFVRFIENETTIACDPVTSLSSLRREDVQLKATKSKNVTRLSKSARSFGTESTDESRKPNHPNTQYCRFCKNSGHEMDTCHQFTTKRSDERKQFVMKNGLCFGCLSHGHLSKDCKERMKCKTCSKHHPTCFHEGNAKQTDSAKNKTDKANDEQMSSTTSTTHSSNTHNVLSETSHTSKSTMIVPVWISHFEKPEKERLVYALLDTQSDTTFILESTARALDIEGTDTQLRLSTMLAKDQIVKSERFTGLQIRAYNDSCKMPLPLTYSREIIPAGRAHIPTPEMARKWPHLECIASELLPLNNCEVGLLIGYNCPQALAPKEIIPCVKNGPYAQKSILGWGIIGLVNPNEINNDSYDSIGFSHRILATEDCSVKVEPSSQISFVTRSKVKEVFSPEQITRILQADFSENQTEEITLSQNDKRFIEILQYGTSQRSDGHYEVPLPFKDSNSNLSDNRLFALRRLLKLKGRLKRDKDYKNQYTEFINKMLLNGHAEKIPLSEQSKNTNVWYLAHRGVYHPQKPSKLRVVFDASASFNGISLNDQLLRGPDLINSLLGILLRFRQDNIAFMCDVEKMFHQFAIKPEQRDFLRFLWWESGNLDSEPIDMRMCVHIFGATSSPGCAMFGLRKIASDYEEAYGSDAKNFIHENFYVDDGLKSVSSAEEAIQLLENTTKLCARGGLTLHKIVSNCTRVTDSLSNSDQSTCRGLPECTIERALGVQWCIVSDSFKFRITLADRPLTRRGVLSTLGSVYDPFGFVAPMILRGKQILRIMCAERTDWDSPLSDTLRSDWERWRYDICKLERLEIKRCFKPSNFGTVTSVSLHYFSDASTSGYGQCTYIRLEDDRGEVHCALVLGKSRVAPLKTVTIPRLELTAALVSVRVSQLLRRELEYHSVREYFWTDSQVVLAYINSESHRFRTFVANRVQEIRNNTEPAQWRYINTKDNPADIASRGLSANDLVKNSTWLAGPSFLWKPDPLTDSLTTDTSTPLLDDPEVKQGRSLSTVASPDDILDRLEYFSDWHKAKRAMAACMKLQKKFKSGKPKRGKSVSRDYIPVQVDEIEQAEQEIFKLVQNCCFSEEMSALKKENLTGCVQKTSPIFRLDPFLDTKGLLRVGGRLKAAHLGENEKHPLILPRKHHITQIIIRYHHKNCGHQGRGMTLGEIRRSGIWIIGCTSAVSQVISKCVRCRRLRGTTETQRMADLPPDRLETEPPFTYSGVDYFGPWTIKEGRKQLKRYGVIFTCLSSRAVHLETSNSLDTSSFINALRRFISTRGPVRQLRSDRGTNFVGARRELREGLAEMDDNQIHQYLSEKHCDYINFQMNFPSSSHMGGVWERQIRTVRNVLDSLIDQAGTQLDDEGLRTLMCEVSSIVNSRPLTTDTLNDPMSLEPLTPNHLLTMKSKLVLPPPGNFQQADVYSRKRWRRVQYLASIFWTRWKKEYLQNLQVRQKWNKEKRNMRTGDIVIVKDDNLPRNQWRLARIAEVFPESDGHVRKVKLFTADSTNKNTSCCTPLERPIHKLVLLVEAE